MDPLSVAASVIGLLSAAAKISQQLRIFWTGFSGAPKSAQNVLLEVSTISACLGQMQSLLLGTAEMTRSRTSLLMVEQVLVCLTNCVSVFSELEEILDNLGTTQQPMRRVDQLRWALKEGAISKIFIRLQATKVSLNLMLTTLTCNSIEEAQASGDELAMLVRQVLDSNQEMTKRLRVLERQNNVIFSSDRSTNGALEAHNDAGSAIGPSRQNSLRSSNTEVQRWSRPRAYPFTFDQVLQRTRVYSRTARLPDRPFSLSSSAVQSVGWSVLSELSVSDVSNISVLALPIFIDDLYNSQHFATNQDLEIGLPEDQPSCSQIPHCENLAFKPFDGPLDDPCPIFIAATLRRLNINGYSWWYSLCITYAGSPEVRRIELGELPMHLFRQLEDEGKNPSFLLQLDASVASPLVPLFEEYSRVAGHGPEYYILENVFAMTESDREIRHTLLKRFGFKDRGTLREQAMVELKSQLPLSPEDRLSNAFRLLSQAEQADNAQDYVGALNGYGSGCGLLQQVMSGCLLYSQWAELRAVRASYRSRYNELREVFMSNQT